jgi:hypothetical protein
MTSTPTTRRRSLLVLEAHSIIVKTTVLSVLD